MGAFSVAAQGNYDAVAIGTTAAVIVAAGTRSSVVIQNLDASNDLYVGFDASVTASNGFHLASNDSIKFDDYLGPVYGIGSASDTDVRFLEVK